LFLHIKNHSGRLWVKERKVVETEVEE